MKHVTGRLSLLAFSVAAGVFGQSLSLSLATPSTAGVGVPAVLKINVNGGMEPFSYSVSPTLGLPPGLTFDSELPGFTGTPTLAGSYPVVVGISDAAGGLATLPITLTIQPPIMVTAVSLPAASPGVSYAQQLSATGGGGSYMFSIASGSLPPGFRIDARGIVGGVATASGTYTFTVRVTDWQGSTATLPVTLSVMTAGPVFTAAQVVNGASFAAGLAPGAYGTLTGSSISTSTASGTLPSLPDSLLGTMVFLNGTPLKLLAVTPQQVNFQIPFTTTPGPVDLSVGNSTGTSSKVSVQVDVVAPGIFLNGAGRALAINQDNTINSATVAAASGSIVVLYLTGGGAFQQDVPYGGVAPATAAIRLSATVTATIGGSAAPVLYAGTAPGLGSGLVQLNLRVPTLQGGDYPVKVTVGGKDSNTPVITVK